MQEYLTKNHSFNNRSHSNYHTLEFCLKEVRRKENFPDQYERRVFFTHKNYFQKLGWQKEMTSTNKEVSLPKTLSVILSKSISNSAWLTSMGMSKSHQSVKSDPFAI